MQLNGNAVKEKDSGRVVLLTRLPVGTSRPLAYVRLEGGRPVQFELEPPGNKERTGNIYVGKIERLVPAVQAAFVRISPEQSGYLPLAKAKQPLARMVRADGSLREQDELLVQVEREAIKGKLPSLTAALEFPGSLMVLLTDHPGIFFSPRLSEKEKLRVGARLEQLRKGRALSFGVLVRTNGGKASDSELSHEFEALYREAERICRYGLTRSVYSRLKTADSFWMELLEGLPRQEAVEIVTDEKEIYEELNGRFGSRDGALPGESFQQEASVRLYQSDLQPLYKKYGLEELLGRLLERKVELPLGGFLVIEQTEAFVAVDVNSGKRGGSQAPDEFYYRVNLEAAKEIARQLRLRNLSGTVLIDFINMKDPALSDRLCQELQRRFLEDPVRTRVIDVTRLNITEVTRQKVRRPLWEQAKQYGKEPPAKAGSGAGAEEGI